MLDGFAYSRIRAALARKACERDGHYRSILMATFRSPATLHYMDEEHRRCPWCRSHLGTHEHIFWQCRDRPPGPPRPQCQLQARLGWPMGDGSGADEKIMQYMAKIAKKVLDERYNRKERSGEDTTA